MSEAELVAQESEEMEVVPSTPEQTMETETEPETKEEPKVEADAEKETEEEEKEPEEEKAEEEEKEPEKEKTDEEPVQPKEKRGRLSRAAKEPAKKVDTPKTDTRARQAKQKVPEKKEEPKEETPLGKRKRTAVQQAVQTPQASAKKGKKVHSLHFEDFITWEAGSRVLACGEGEQLGHPGRTTSKKPRKVDVIEDENLKIVQVVAGGVHSVILAETGEVYSCGINEKGTVPAEGVEAEGSTDEYTKIVFSDELQKEGKIVMLSAGASFTAALTNHGTVIAWGNLRDGSGKMDVHPQLIEMQKNPIIILRHKPGFSIVKIAAGENHLVMLSDDGRVFTFGDFSMGQLGRSNRLDRIRTQYIAADSESSLHVTIMDKRKKAKCKNVFAGGFWSAFLTEDDKLFVCGLNNFGHLGIAIDEPEAKDSSDDSGDDTELRILLPQFSPELSGHNWTHIEGVQHLVLRDSNGDIYCIGKNTDNALGLGSWSNSDKDKNWRYQTLQKLEIADSAGVTAQLGCSLAWNQKGSAVAWGYDSSGQLGLGLKDDDDRVVPKPDEISSAHLEGFKIVQVSVADNHAIFLAAKN